ncbi:MAG: Inward rectifier potassium channel Irk [Bacteroidetes bacterium]|nr:Inward rectifier potassium channel Irk [Bacteroidota bacterium]MBS1628907.1 Inward rectifier potassium channel Irk [Bacteroidota bacterium]
MAKANMRYRFRNLENTGFPTSTGKAGTRMIDRTGAARIRKSGFAFWRKISIYHSLIQMPRWKFLFLVFAFYTLMNLAFALIYFALGTEHLAGAEAATSSWQQFVEAFFFSAQSLTTVGYGRVAPVGLITNTIASGEALVGILSFAVVTGIFYGRFSRPRAYLLFSKNMLVAPFRNGRALMFRLASYKNNFLTDVEASAMLVLHQPKGESRDSKYFTLKLDISRISALALNWTVVHVMDEHSPLFGMEAQSLIEQNAELIVSIKAFDDNFSNTVQQRSSYTHHDLVYGARFLPMFQHSDTKGLVIMALDKISDYEPAALPEFQHTPE